jgi:hypothetical protein
MAQFLRKIKRSRWHGHGEHVGLKETSPELLPSDILGDVATSNGGRLSVWYIDADNIQRVMIALGASAGRLEHSYFMFFPDSAVAAAGITAVPEPGQTPDADANTKWHLDLCIANAMQLVRLARILWDLGEMRVMLESDLRDHIRNALAAGYLKDSPTLRKLAR